MSILPYQLQFAKMLRDVAGRRWPTPTVCHSYHCLLCLPGPDNNTCRPILNSLLSGMMDQMDQAFKKQQKTIEAKRATHEIKRVEVEIR